MTKEKPFNGPRGGGENDGPGSGEAPRRRLLIRDRLAVDFLVLAAGMLLTEFIVWLSNHAPWQSDSSKMAVRLVLWGSILFGLSQLMRRRMGTEWRPGILERLSDTVAHTLQWVPYACFCGIGALVLFQVAYAAGAGKWLPVVTSGGIPVVFVLFVLGGCAYLFWRYWERKEERLQPE